MSFALGHTALGTQALASGPLHDPPVINLIAPVGTVSSGGPIVTASWTYTQPQGDIQDRFRVTVKNNLSVVVFDSGWLVSSVTSYDLDWDGLGLPGDGAYTVDLEVQGAGWLIPDSQAFTAALGTPQLTITAPTAGMVHTVPDSIATAWTFSDPGHTQSQYRIRLLSPESKVELYSTGWVTSGLALATVPFLFSDNTQIRVEIQARNENGMRSA